MAQSYGEASSTTTTMPIWSPNISDGAKATFINGSITVLNSSGTTVFSTPNSTSPPSSYIGCYGDSSTRAMPMYNNGSHQYNKSECQQIAQENGATYYGLQDSTSGENAQCALSSNLTQKQIFTVEQIKLAMRSEEINTYKAPASSDVLARITIPIDKNNKYGQKIFQNINLEYTKRSYFGPVSLSKFRIQLLNDRGYIVNLNNMDWSFSLLVKQQYQYT